MNADASINFIEDVGYQDDWRGCDGLRLIITPHLLHLRHRLPFKKKMLSILFGITMLEK